MVIIHGEDIVSSRNHLNNLILASTAKDLEIKRHSAKDLDLTLVAQILEGLTLFGKKPVLVIEGLFSLPKSKNKDLLLDFLAKYSDQEIILYEAKALTPTMVKLFPKARISDYKPAPIVFTFLESLRPGSASRSLRLFTALENAGQPAELVFAMLVRQVRLLVQALEPSSLKVAPWQATRLTTQARAFGEERLLKLHRSLYQIDKGIKTGANPTDLSIQLFNLVAGL